MDKEFDPEAAYIAAHGQADADALAAHDEKVGSQCGRAMNPVDRMLGPTCLPCCKANHKVAVMR